MRSRLRRPYWYYNLKVINKRGRHGHDHVVVGQIYIYLCSQCLTAILFEGLLTPRGEVYSICHFVITFISSWRQVTRFSLGILVSSNNKIYNNHISDLIYLYPPVSMWLVFINNFIISQIVILLQQTTQKFRRVYRLVGSCRTIQIIKYESTTGPLLNLKYTVKYQFARHLLLVRT